VVEDDLGYYPDGNKRTLTDDQIAMFRHSEIYSILRERQVLKENREADGDERSEGETSSFEEAAPAPLASSEQGEVQSGGIAWENNASVKHFEQDRDTGSARTASRNKRKRNQSDLGDRHGREPTHRRLARELDSIVADEQILDYGDEPSTPTERTAPQPEIAPEAAATITGNAASEAGACAQDRKPLVEGKKIWWPVLGTRIPSKATTRPNPYIQGALKGEPLTFRFSTSAPIT